MNKFTKADVMELKNLLSEAWELFDMLEGSAVPALRQAQHEILKALTDITVTRQGLAAAINKARAVL